MLVSKAPVASISAIRRGYWRSLRCHCAVLFNGLMFSRLFSVGFRFKNSREGFSAFGARFSRCRGHCPCQHGASSVNCFMVDGNSVSIWPKFDVGRWDVLANCFC